MGTGNQIRVGMKTNLLKSIYWLDITDEEQKYENCFRYIYISNKFLLPLYSHCIRNCFQTDDIIFINRS